jgi:GAF domain-containing protein
MIRYEEGSPHPIAFFGVPQAYVELAERGGELSEHAPSARVARTKQIVHVADFTKEYAYAVERHPMAVAGAEIAGIRTLLVVPMLKEGDLIGNISIYRQKVRPFTDKQIALVQNFAAQAVIAIENARLLNELRQRTTDLSESLKQQTATSEVLSVISSSPGELQPVFNTMLENALRVCEAKFGLLFRFDGTRFHPAAEVGTPPEYAEFTKRRGAFTPVPGGRLDQVMRLKQVSYSADHAADAIPGPAARLGGARSAVCVPMLKDEELIGAFVIYRLEVRPFTDKQIALLQNFAAQAVIAIENTRLLNELRQSLEQQTATADVLRVISSSPGELEPVFQAMLENATRLCEAKFGVLSLSEGDALRVVAMHNVPPAYAE